MQRWILRCPRVELASSHDAIGEPWFCSNLRFEVLVRDKHLTKVRKTDVRAAYIRVSWVGLAEIYAVEIRPSKILPLEYIDFTWNCAFQLFERLA